MVPDESTQKDCICVDSSWEKIQMLPAAHIDLHLQTQMCHTIKVDFYRKSPRNVVFCASSHHSVKDLNPNIRQKQDLLIQYRSMH